MPCLTPSPLKAKLCSEELLYVAAIDDRSGEEEMKKDEVELDGEESKSLRDSLTKFTSQIKKPPRRKNSLINWFPRKKMDSYLKKKIKILQDVSGMKLTFDETLNDTNPHYSRVLKEKIAAREATHKAMEARKVALVEASRCRILHAAR
ncbi:hypothetical protein ACFE04_021115 [Oxalis oulophora]